jgi:hypothetical protein
MSELSSRLIYREANQEATQTANQSESKELRPRSGDAEACLARVIEVERPWSPVGTTRACANIGAVFDLKGGG